MDVRVSVTHFGAAQLATMKTEFIFGFSIPATVSPVCSAPPAVLGIELTSVRLTSRIILEVPGPAICPTLPGAGQTGPLPSESCIVGFPGKSLRRGSFLALPRLGEALQSQARRPEVPVLPVPTTPFLSSEGSKDSGTPAEL